MKKYVFAMSISLLMSSAFAGKIDSYKDLRKQLLKGESLKALVYYDLCFQNSQGKKALSQRGPDDMSRVAGIKFSGFSIYKPEGSDARVIATGKSHLVVRNGTPLRLFHRIRVDETDTVDVAEFELNPATSEVLMEKHYQCVVDHSVFFEKL